MDSSQTTMHTFKEQCPIKQEEYQTELQAALQNGKTPVYVDESGFRTESVRQFAYAPRGVCVSDKISSNRYRCTTLIAAQMQGRFTVPVLFEGACDTLAFNAWLENVLCPLLDTSHVVILDNASCLQAFFHQPQERSDNIYVS